MATVCAGALKFGSSAPRMAAIPIQDDIEISSQPCSRTQASEVRVVDTRHVAGPASRNPSNRTLLAKVRRFGSKILVKISKMHLRRYVATAWVVTITISLLSVMAAIGPLLWYTHAAARHGNDSQPSRWRTCTSFVSKYARDYFPRTASSFADLDQVVASAAGMTVFAFSFCDAARAYCRVYYSSESLEQRERA